MSGHGGKGKTLYHRKKAVDLPQRVQFVLLFAAVSITFSHVDVTQHVKKCLTLERETKTWTRCGRSTAPPPSHAEKKKPRTTHLLFLCPLCPCDVVCHVVLCCVGVHVVSVVLSVVWCCWWSWCVFGVSLVCVQSSRLHHRGLPKEPLDLTHFQV